MKKLLFSLLTVSCSLLSWADGQDAQISSTPTPAISNKPLEVTITTDNMGSEVYCYTWCHKVNGSEKEPTWGWDDVHTAKFKMTGSNGTYKLDIQDIKEFYGLSDSELEGLTELGFIAKTSSGQQTKDLFIAVEQGRRDAYSGGEGTAADPFILKTADDLQTLAATSGDWAAGTYLKMEADIDASALRTAIGSTGSPFAANFDGNGHSISNLNLSSNTLGSPLGLFGVVKGGEVSNLGVISASVSGANSVGILVGELESGLIQRCFTSGSAKGTSICVGGLVGENVSGSILDCYSGAKVENPSDYAVGGLVGKNRGTLTNTYSAGEVSGYDYVGGLVGANYGIVKNSFALNASVTAENDFVARFGGNNNSRNSADQTYSWEDMVAGHITWTMHGHHAEMKKSTTFRDENQFRTLSGWDFNNVWEWRKEGNKEYPALRSVAGQTALLSDAYFSGTTAADGPTVADYLKIGPNPTSGELHIISSAGIALYELCTLSGSVAMQGQPAAFEVTLDLSGFAEGLYILRTVTLDGKEQSNKIIKK